MRSRRNEDRSENSSGRVSNKLPVIYCYLVAGKLAFCQIFLCKIGSKEEMLVVHTRLRTMVKCGKGQREENMEARRKKVRRENERMGKE